MLFNSSYIFFLSLLVVLVVQLLKWTTRSKWVYSLSMVVANIVILRTILDEFTLIALSVIALLAYLFGWILLNADRSVQLKRTILVTALSLFVGAFAIRNYPDLQDWLVNELSFSWSSKLNLVGRIGLSYILFRLLHYLVDAYRGQIKSNPFLTFWNYIFFFPTFLSGPIDRFQNFAFWEAKGPSKINRVMWFQGIGKIFLGALKKFALVPIFLPYVNDFSLLSELSGNEDVQFVYGLLNYSLYIFFDFSGYSDIAIGTAYLMGIRTPENFKNPYFSPNIADFWRRWHISFSTILGEYVFRPFVVGLSKRATFLPRLVVSGIGYTYTFIICGLWHGNTLNFVYWGLWHALGLIIHKVFEWVVYKTTSYKDQRTFVQKTPSILLTFLFVTVGWFFFQRSANDIENVISHYVTGSEIEYYYDNPIQFHAGFEVLYGQNTLVGSFSIKEKSGRAHIQIRQIGAKEWRTLEKAFDAKKSRVRLWTPNGQNESYELRVQMTYPDRVSPWYGTIVEPNPLADE